MCDKKSLTKKAERLTKNVSHFLFQKADKKSLTKIRFERLTKNVKHFLSIFQLFFVSHFLSQAFLSAFFCQPFFVRFGPLRIPSFVKKNKV